MRQRGSGFRLEITYVTQGRDLCGSRSVRCRALIKALSIAVADDEDDAKHFVIVGRHGSMDLGDGEPVDEPRKRGLL